jgi:hypothetical protein
MKSVMAGNTIPRKIVPVACPIRSREYHLTVLRWARWARTEVEAWPEDLSRLDATTEFRKVVSAADSLPDGTWQPEPRRRKGNPPLHSV